MVDNAFVSLIGDVLTNGESVNTRNSLVMRAIGKSVVFRSTPLVSLRKTAWKTALREWEWFMSGSSRLDDLHLSVHSWWSAWADKHGSISNNYSEQFRYFSARAGGSFDQIAWVIDAIRSHPYSRRNVITTWNPYEMQLSETPITNCHGTSIQFFGNVDGSLSMLMYQRSVDVILGLPHNWIQYWAFLMWVAHRTGRTVGQFHWLGGDVHVYGIHRPMYDRMKALTVESTPQLVYKPSSDEFLADDFSLDGEYVPLINERLPMVV